MIGALLTATLLLTSIPALATSKQHDQPEKSADSADTIICKRFPVTGSLVQRTRVCKTKREWEQERDAVRPVSGRIDSCANKGINVGC